MEYRRVRVGGGCYFFTVVTHRRLPLLRNAAVRRHLGDALRRTAGEYPFRVDGIVLLPDHLHCLWTLPENDSDFPLRWRLIKRRTTMAAGHGNLWQPRFWEHLIRDDRDFRNHLEYIHYNPVKHGHVGTPKDWPWSSFHRYVREGVYEPDWGSTAPELPEDVGRE